MKEFQVGYGSQKLTFSFAEAVEVDEIRARSSAPIQDIDQEIRQVLDYPIGCKPLRELVLPGEKVVIVVSDITRLWVRTDLLLPILLEVLNEIGISDHDITIVTSTGDHRAHTEKEHIMICGENVAGRIRIVDHDCHADDLVDLGTSSRGTPIKINRQVWEADRVILTGGISYHLLAGFGGGRKSIAPGVCGYETIQKNHGLALPLENDWIVDARVGIGQMEGNPVAEDMLEIALKVNPDFMINVVVNENNEFIKVVAGELQQAHKAGCLAVEQLYGIPVNKKAELVIASCGGYPKDIQLYQAIKALDNAAYAVKDGGIIILAAECSDGIGSKPFFEFFKKGDSAALRESLRQNFSMPEFIALRTASICTGASVILMSSLPDEIARQVKMLPCHSEQEALDLAGKILGQQPESVFMMPYGSSTFPIVDLSNEFG